MDVTATRKPSHAPITGPIVLVGLSGAGKTVVAERLAVLLGWEVLDLDAEIERLGGRPIAAIFGSGGEAEFRDLEARITRSVKPGPHTIVATGGGWMARPELRDSWPGACRVWLRVTPSTAVERLAKERITRPLLAGPDPLGALETLLVSRLPAYALAEYTVETDGRTPAQVAEAVLAALDV